VSTDVGKNSVVAKVVLEGVTTRVGSSGIDTDKTEEIEGENKTVDDSVSLNTD
jgi:hypothetical protein